MTISPFRYPGGKTKVLPILMEHINHMMVNQTAFTDACVGGGCVALEVAAKYPKIDILINDKDEWMYSFWSIVAGSNRGDLQDLLNLIDQPVTIDLFYALREDPDERLLKKAYKAIFFNRTAFSGILKSGPIGGKEQKSQYKVDCRYNATKIREKILACNKLLQGRTSVTNLDIIDCLNSNDNLSAIYLDPPYYKKGAALYIEFMKPEEHVAMANLLDTKKKWLLSYDDCPEIRALYSQHEIIDLSMRYSINGKKTDWSSKNELLILC